MKTPCCKSEKYFDLYEFTCIIKSHCEIPDYDQCLLAINREEAQIKFAGLTHLTVKDVEDAVDEGEETEFCRCSCGKRNLKRELIKERCEHEGEHKRGICLECGEEV